MNWKVSDVMSQRKDFVVLASVDGANVSQLCERFGIARKTGYKWLNRYRQSGMEGLSDRPRTPHSFRSPTHNDVENIVLEIRDQHPAWGGRKIRARMQHLGFEHVPAASTMTQILRRHGKLSTTKKTVKPFVRFEHKDPNDLWQIDFKGEFSMSNHRRCYPLTLLDDHSRFALGLVACDGTTVNETQSALIPIFRKYGVPQAIYADNGPPFGAIHSPGRHTRLTAWMMRQGIRVVHGTPYHPQGRGKEERFHRTLKLELLQDRHFDDLLQSQQAFDPWRDMYNHERPHQSLDMQVPASRYQASSREYIEHTKRFEYSSRFEVRRTNYSGRFKFKGRTWEAGGAFSKDSIGLEPTENEKTWRVYYCHFAIGILDMTSERNRLKPLPRPTETPESNEETQA